MNFSQVCRQGLLHVLPPSRAVESHDPRCCVHRSLAINGLLANAAGRLQRRRLFEEGCGDTAMLIYGTSQLYHQRGSFVFTGFFHSHSLHVHRGNHRDLGTCKEADLAFDFDNRHRDAVAG